MPAQRKKNLFGWLTKKREVYRRDVKGERAELIRQAKADQRARKREEAEAKRDRAKYLREKAADEKARAKKHRDREKREDAYQRELRRKEEAQIKKEELAERRKKLERKRADAVDRKIEAEWRRTGAKNPVRKRNPEAAAAELSEAWHGRPAKDATDIFDKVRYHGVLTDLGRLQEITVMVTERKGQKILFDAETRLCSSENGKQLYVVGGDQSIDLADLGIEGEEAEKDCVVVGDVFSVVYVTAKQHLGKADREVGPYEHELGEDGGSMPVLLYDTLNQQVGFAGGSYFIDPTDFDGSHSAGIRN